jgi:dihydroflavonol-4-reductase
VSAAVVTGASGLLGGNLVIELLERGHSVRATRRGTSKVAHLADLAIDWVTADLDDVGALTEAFLGADVVFHCAALVSVRRRPTPALVRANVDGTKHVLAAVRAANVKRLVHCSTVGAVGLSDDGAPCTEEQRWNFPEHDLDDGYVTTKHEAEELVRAAAAAGLDAVIANPSYMLGPLDARPSSGKLIVNVISGKVPGRTPGWNNFVDVRDVAKGMLLVWQKGRAGERYILGGENLPYADVFDRIARIAGVKAPTWNIPRLLAAPLGWVGDLREAMSDAEPLINTMTVRYGYCKAFIFSSEKAERELGYTTRPIDDAIRDAIAWFRAHGMLAASDSAS